MRTLLQNWNDFYYDVFCLCEALFEIKLNAYALMIIIVERANDYIMVGYALIYDLSQKFTSVAKHVNK